MSARVCVHTNTHTQINMFKCLVHIDHLHTVLGIFLFSPDRPGFSVIIELCSFYFNSLIFFQGFNCKTLYEESLAVLASLMST